MITAKKTATIKLRSVSCDFDDDLLVGWSRVLGAVVGGLVPAVPPDVIPAVGVVVVVAVVVVVLVVVAVVERGVVTPNVILPALHSWVVHGQTVALIGKLCPR